MELKPAFFLVAIVCGLVFLSADAEIVRKKNIKIHIPLEVRHHKHTHTITKNIHHYHKPRRNLKDITSQDLRHEHVHHHYRDEDNQLIIPKEHGAFASSSSNKKEVRAGGGGKQQKVRFEFQDNFVNIENEALESLAVLQSSASELKPQAYMDVVVPAASVQSTTKVPPVARSRTHANSRRRSPTTKAPTTTTSTTARTTTEKPATAAEDSA